MESNNENDNDIIFSKSIRAGKRIYYLDVKKNRKDEMYLAITESKKIINSDSETPQITFEKHKIFLYQEDFEKVMNGLKETMGYIQDHNQTEDVDLVKGEDINIDIDF